MQFEDRSNEENTDSVVYFSIIIVVYFSITTYPVTETIDGYEVRFLITGQLDVMNVTQE